MRCFETSVKSAAEMHSMIIVTIIFIKQKLKKHENANNWTIAHEGKFKVQYAKN